MGKQDEQSGDGAPPDEQRANRHMAERVQRALALLALVGEAEAERYLRQHRASPELIRRLLDGGPRRLMHR
ncbi:hypothetical protein GJ700_18450 [Duganella sp. FT92W]|uniref:Uncharacterized protein n=1 Tax=Pseudoduganella rivuli TaxID=2666085 RepID=A0A7X2LV47_9BURK|nr:hypothetical protein [Pseudoduganella rivuli]MRV73697.1 hypothetical protein [Pseudoduganella rivuli]